MTTFEIADADLVAVYDRLAPAYNRLHKRWLRHAGGEAQAALEASVRALMGPNSKLLDAGCGTGTFARRLLAEGVSADNITLLDPSYQMLRQCDDIPCFKVKQRLDDLPFSDEQFDIVSCAWALETVPELETALAQMCRVLHPGGFVCLVFCAERPCRGVRDWIASRMILWRGAGRFLPVDHVKGVLAERWGFDVRDVPLSGAAAMLLAQKPARHLWP